MKIGIDTFGCNHGKSGAGSSVLNFISNIPEALKSEIQLFGAEIDRYTYTSSNGLSFASANVKDNLKAERKWHERKFNSFVKKQEYDVVLFTAIDKVIAHKYSKAKAVAIVNTVISVSLDKDSRKYRNYLQKNLNRLDLIIAGSEFIKKDLLKLDVPENKIQVIYNGLDHKLFYPMPDLDEEVVEINPFSIKRPYFIYGSTLSGPDKKHLELIQAFTLLKKKLNIPHRLVLAGADGDYSQQVHKAAFESEFASDIFITGFFPHESFPKLYAGAEACIVPSVNEGVGLPVLEAMACGIPVLCSNSGALKEIGGMAALYFDSNDVQQIASALESVITNPEFKAKMISDGLDRCAGFSWDKTVENTFAALKQL